MKFDNLLRDYINDNRQLQAVDEPKPFSVKYIKGYDQHLEPDDFAVNDMVDWKIVNATGDGRFMVKLNFSVPEYVSTSEGSPDLIELNFGKGDYFVNSHHGQPLEEDVIVVKRIVPQVMAGTETL